MLSRGPNIHGSRDTREQETAIPLVAAILAANGRRDWAVDFKAVLARPSVSSRVLRDRDTVVRRCRK
jgi:hypothetical protein